MNVLQIIAENKVVVQQLKVLYFRGFNIEIGQYHQYITLDGKTFRLVSSMPDDPLGKRIRGIRSIADGIFPPRDNAFCWQGLSHKAKIELVPREWFDIDNDTKTVTLKKGPQVQDMLSLITTLAEIYTQEDFNRPGVEEFYKWIAVRTILKIIQFKDYGLVNLRVHSELYVDFSRSARTNIPNKLANELYTTFMQHDENWLDLFEILQDPWRETYLYGLQKNDIRTRIIFAIVKEIHGGQVLLPNEYPNYSELQRIICQLLWNNDNPKRKASGTIRIIDYTEPINGKGKKLIELPSEPPEGYDDVIIDQETTRGIISLLESEVATISDATDEETEE